MGKAGGKREQLHPRVSAAFRKAKEGGKVCPFYQSGSCQYGSNCRFKNECFICGDRNHGANKCPQLESGKAKDKLGL